MRKNPTERFGESYCMIRDNKTYIIRDFVLFLMAPGLPRRQTNAKYITKFVHSENSKLVDADN